MFCPFSRPTFCVGIDTGIECVGIAFYLVIPSPVEFIHVIQNLLTTLRCQSISGTSPGIKTSIKAYRLLEYNEKGYKLFSESCYFSFIIISTTTFHTYIGTDVLISGLVEPIHPFQNLFSSFSGLSPATRFRPSI